MEERLSFTKQSTSKTLLERMEEIPSLAKQFVTWLGFILI